MISSGKELLIALVALIIIFGGVMVTRTTPTDVPLKAAEPPREEIAVNLHTVHSPDGTRKIVLKSQPLLDGNTEYIVTTSAINGSDRHGIYEATLPGGSTIALSPNSWSPDNAFVFFFIRTMSGMDVLVYAQDGTNMIDMTALFYDKLPESILRNVTGWDDPALLHVMTYNRDMTIGSSYWFDIWGKSFIQLAHR